ncbi:eukaryotic translation initiation factor 5B-like [Medicago truncatula]|uniref:eukaryotic translation initiation factor 5B-like n=1 Tax=Medicago truncatula TaxID=3880 RepID=UPI001966E4A1|nr:eukaryotic translation initiation factor 5B-like [Medicago truncatula]
MGVNHSSKKPSGFRLLNPPWMRPGRKSKKKQITKEEYLADDATEKGTQKHQKAKKEKSAMSTIQEEVEDLDEVPLIRKRKRSAQETAEQLASERAASEQVDSEKPLSPKKTREAALQTIRNKRTRDLKTAEGSKEDQAEQPEEEPCAKKAKNKPSVMPMYVPTAEQWLYARNYTRTGMAKMKELRQQKKREEQLKAAGYKLAPEKAAEFAALAAEVEKETVQEGVKLLSQALKDKQASEATSSEPASKASEAALPEAHSSGTSLKTDISTQIPDLPSSLSSSSTESDDQPLSQHIEKLLNIKPTKLTEFGTFDYEQTQIEFSKNRIKLCEKFNLPASHPLYPVIP